MDIPPFSGKRTSPSNTKVIEMKGFGNGFNNTLYFERAEKEALKLYKKELRCNYQEAIEAYCRDWDASGIGKSLPFAQKVNETGHVLNLRPAHESK